MNKLQLKLCKTRWMLIAAALVFAGLLVGFEKLFR